MAVPVLKMATIGLLPSCLKKIWYRFRGAKIGRNVSLGLLSIIDCPSIEIGDDTSIAPLSFITARKLRLGKRVSIRMLSAIDTGEVEIGDDSIIGENTIIGGMLTPESRLVLGKRVHIQVNVTLNPTFPIVIGDDSALGGNTYVFTHASHLSVLDGFPRVVGPVSIGRNSWIAWHNFIHPNVTIGDNVLVSAGSVVSTNLPTGCLAFGSPAKVVAADGRYILKRSEAGRHKIVMDILNSYAQYREYMGDPTELRETENGAKLTITTKARSAERVAYRRDLDPFPDWDCDAYISLASISEILRAELSARGKVWFDLEDKRTRLSRAPVWKGLKDFLNRYGIRFEVLD
jgi:acetyltransferase-like isoleucine patch superfamily enzyme